MYTCEILFLLNLVTWMIFIHNDVLHDEVYLWSNFFSIFEDIFYLI